MKRIACIGECMVEIGLSAGSPTAAVGFGGDTLNTAIYLARSLSPTVGQAFYVTDLGYDPFAEEMLAAWQKENIDTRFANRVPGRTTGLYAISVDPTGERSFHYWRDAAPAREMLSDLPGEALYNSLAEMDALYFSGITLAILRPEGQERLLTLAEQFKADGKLVAYDPNHRGLLWIGQDFIDMNQRAFAAASLALPSRDEVTAILPGGLDELVSLCSDEIVLRHGGPSLDLYLDGEWTPLALLKAPQVADTTAAGDSFNGTYLAARLSGIAPIEAAKRAHAVALAVIAQRGAVIPKDAMPTFEPA